MSARILSATDGAARLAAAKAAAAAHAAKMAAGSKAPLVAPTAPTEVSFAEAFARDASAFEFDFESAPVEVELDPASAAASQGYTPGWKPAPVAKAAPAVQAAPAPAARKQVKGGYIPLGYDGPDNVIWSNTRNCVVRIKAAEISLPVMETWAGLDWVMANYLDASGDEKKASKLNIGRLRSELIADCQIAGPFDASKVFGAGIWEIKIGDERVAVCNSKGQVFAIDGRPVQRITDAGIFADCRNFGMAPTTREATDSEVIELAQAFESWNWRNSVDSLLVLGWIAASPFAGVLTRRPGLFITGARGCGKSTLLDAIKRVLGASAVKADGADSTAAGIRQYMRNDARPLILDEFGDNSSDSMRSSDRVKAIMSAIRTAYGDETGDGVIKGTQDGHGASYSTAYMPVMAGIVPPPMQPADRSRMAICTLAPLPVGAIEPDLIADVDALEDLGDRIRMRMFKLWPAAKASIKFVRTALRAAGREARFADTIGTLLACWYVLTTGRALDQSSASVLVSQVDLSRHAAAVEGASDERECADWLLGYTDKETGISVGELISRVVDGKKEYAPRLEAMGLKLDGRELQVCGSKSVEGIRRLFEGSKFADGGWKIVLERVDGAKHCSPRFAGKQTRSTAIPLAWLFEEPTQGELLV